MGEHLLDLIFHPQALLKQLSAVSHTDVGGSHRAQKSCYYFSKNKQICLHLEFFPSGEKTAPVIKDCTIVHIYKRNKIQLGQCSVSYFPSFLPGIVNKTSFQNRIDEFNSITDL